MTATGGGLLTLKEASLHLAFMPYLVLKFAKHKARKNGGMKLPVHDKDGEPHFRSAELDAFDADLRKPWVNSSTEKRPPIPDYIQDTLKGEAFFCCGLCRAPYGTDFAHIEPWEKCLHHHPGNLICLCARCHDGFDREKRITTADIEAAKKRLRERLLRYIADGYVPMGEHFATLQELCRAIEEMLAQNRLVFINFGPQSPLAEMVAGPTAADVWKRERATTILPNNRRIVELLQKNRHLYAAAPGFPEVAAQFIAHALSYQQYVERPHDAHKYMLFPKVFGTLVETEARKT